MEATALLLVRHGQSEWNALGRWQGQADPPLSEAGRQEAEIAAERLRAEAIDRVCSSPLIRARRTAEIISAAVSDGTVLLEPGMAEIDVGDFSGLTNHEIEERMPEAWASLRGGTLETFPSGESREAFRRRLLAALSAVAVRHPGERIVLVSHGGAIGALERHLDAHPGVGVRNLEARWFNVDGDRVDVAGDRILLAGQES